MMSMTVIGNIFQSPALHSWCSKQSHHICRHQHIQLMAQRLNLASLNHIANITITLMMVSAILSTILIIFTVFISKWCHHQGRSSPSSSSASPLSPLRIPTIIPPFLLATPRHGMSWKQTYLELLSQNLGQSFSQSSLVKMAELLSSLSCSAYLLDNLHLFVPDVRKCDVAQQRHNKSELFRVTCTSH